MKKRVNYRLVFGEADHDFSLRRDDLEQRDLVRGEGGMGRNSVDEKAYKAECQHGLARSGGHREFLKMRKFFGNVSCWRFLPLATRTERRDRSRAA